MRRDRIAAESAELTPEASEESALEGLDLEAEALAISAREKAWLEEEARAPASLEVLEERLSEALAAVNFAQSQVVEALNARREAQMRSKELEAKLIVQGNAVEGDVEVSLEGLRGPLIKSLALCEEEVAKARSLFSEARVALDRQQTEILELRVSQARDSSRIEERISAMRSLTERWVGAGLQGVPNNQDLSDAAESCRDTINAVSSLLATAYRIRDRLQAWLEDALLRNERMVIEKIAGGSGEESILAHTKRLERCVEDAEKSRLHAEKTQAIAGNLADASFSRKGSFCKVLQQDLEVALKHFLPLLIKDETFHQIIAQIDTSKRSTSFTPLSSEGVQIEAVASEGQLSGLGFGVQLAMATSFPWSRWRGLLLDDPLQYSDIVHTSNLVEVLRLLALQHGFQIFLSTHERSLADYVVRKFRNAGLAADRILFRESADGAGSVPVRLR
jgi:exonuclease SbcC